MSRTRAQGEVEVSLGPCQCEGTPHEQDTAWLPVSLDPWDAAEAMAVIFSGDPQEVVETKVQRIFVRHVRTNFSDSLDGLGWETIRTIANAASEQYTAELMAPFPRPLPKSSQHGQTGDSTSPSPPSTSESP